VLTFSSAAGKDFSPNSSKPWLPPLPGEPGFRSGPFRARKISPPSNPIARIGRAGLDRELFCNRGSKSVRALHSFKAGRRMSGGIAMPFCRMASVVFHTRKAFL